MMGVIVRYSTGSPIRQPLEKAIGLEHEHQDVRRSMTRCRRSTDVGSSRSARLTRADSRRGGRWPCTIVQGSGGPAGGPGRGPEAGSRMDGVRRRTGSRCRTQYARGSRMSRRDGRDRLIAPRSRSGPAGDCQPAPGNDTPEGTDTLGKR